MHNYSQLCFEKSQGGLWQLLKQIQGRDYGTAPYSSAQYHFCLLPVSPRHKTTVSVPEKKPATTIEDNRTAILKAEVETDNQTMDNASVQNMAEDEAKEDEIEIVIVPAPTPAPLPKPEPDPLDPNQFIEKSQSYLSGTLGKPDYQFVQESVTIAHYNQPACQMLAFLSDVNGTFKVIHIDLRPPFLGEALYQQACFKQLGVRADEHQSN